MPWGKGSPGTSYGSQSSTDPNPVVFLSRHTAAYTKALCCHTVHLNLTSGPGHKLSMQVKPGAPLQGSQNNQEVQFPQSSSQPVLEVDFGLQSRNKPEAQPGFLNHGLEVQAPRVRKSLWAQAWPGLREDGRHSLVPISAAIVCSNHWD